MKWIRALPLVCLAALAGCGPLLFVQPLYLNTETASDPRLLGEWTADDGTLSFSADGPGYDITFVDRSGSHEGKPLRARLVDLHGGLFLDLQDSADACFGCARLHVITPLRVEGNNLRFGVLNDACFEQAARAKNLATTRTQPSEDLLVLAPTAALREYFTADPDGCVSWDAALQFSRATAESATKGSAPGDNGAH